MHPRCTTQDRTLRAWQSHPKVEEGRKFSREYIHHPHYNEKVENKILFTYKEHNEKSLGPRFQIGR